MFTSRSFIWSVGLRPYLSLTIEKTPSPCAGHNLMKYADCVAKFCHCLRFLSFLERRVSSYLLNLQDNSGVPGLLRSRQVSLVPTSTTASICHPWELDAASRLNSLASSFPVLDQSVRQCALSIPRAFRRTRTVHSRRTCRDSEGQVHRRRLWLCHDPVLSFLFLHLFRHRLGAAGQAEILRAAK